MPNPYSLLLPPICEKCGKYKAAFYVGDQRVPLLFFCLHCDGKWTPEPVRNDGD